MEDAGAYVEILGLYAKYQQMCDADGGVGIEALFCEDSQFTDATGKVVTGRDGIRQHFEEFQSIRTAGGYDRGKHFFALPFITIDGDHAGGAVEMIGILPMDGTVSIVQPLHYEDELVRVDGRWHFASRRLIPLG
jgi:hypothetical protein